MARRALILLFALWSCGIAIPLHGPLLAASAPPAAAEPDASGQPEQASGQPEPAVYADPSQTRLAELSTMEQERQARQRFEAEVEATRKQLQLNYSLSWATVVTNHWHTYSTIREAAAKSKSNSAPCTICDGHGSMDFCVLCGHTGKCVLCNGTKRNGRNELCPACRGTGRCYVCLGSGAMGCPFCDDGIVYLALPPPSLTLPTQVVAASRPVPSPEPPSALGTDSDPEPQLAAQATPEVVHRKRPSPAAEPAQPNWLEDCLRQIGMVVVLFLSGTLVIRKVLLPLADHFNRRSEARTAPVGRASFLPSAFTLDGRSASLAPSFQDEDSDPEGQAHPGEPGKATLDASANMVEAFLRSAPAMIQNLRERISQLGSQAPEGASAKALADLASELEFFKRSAGVHELRPVWQLATLLEALARQLAQRPADLSRSRLASFAAAVYLVEDLCLLKFSPDLAASPSVYIMVVDDDAVARRALSDALAPAADHTDPVGDGEIAVMLAGDRAYDVIFLDVEMPDMDGFELCSRIHQTARNHDTPVVFVSNHGDLDSRAKAAMAGGQDFIAIPFLPFEVALKALTLALRRRLQPGCFEPTAPSQPLNAPKPDACSTMAQSS